MFTQLATIQSNSIINSAVGIEFRCSNHTGVDFNIIMEVGTALDSVPDAISTVANTYFNVGTIRSGGR